jgi:phosphate transport system substrate-binding protein
VYVRGTARPTVAGVARFDRWYSDLNNGNRIDNMLMIAGVDWQPYKDVHIMPNVEAKQYISHGNPAPSPRTTSCRPASPSTTASAGRSRRMNERNLTMKTHSIRRILGVAALAALAAAPASAQNLTGAGATFPYPLYSKWFDVYHEKTGIQINYQSIGSGGGIQQVKAGTVDFGASDAALSNDRLKEMPRKVLHFPTVAGAVAIGTTSRASAARSSSRPICSPGSTWARSRCGTTQDRRRQSRRDHAARAHPSDPPLGRQRHHEHLRHLPVAGEHQWKEMVGANTAVSWPAGVGGKGNEGVAGLVRQTPGRSATSSWPTPSRTSCRGAVRNKAGSSWSRRWPPPPRRCGRRARRSPRTCARRSRTAAAPDAYPIAGLTFLLVYQDQKDPARAQGARELHRLGDPRRAGVAESLEYARLPEAVVKVNEATSRSSPPAGSR